MNNLKNDLKMLNNGILPPSMNFSNSDELNKGFDIEKIQYNSFKRVFEKRFSNLYELPAFDDIIDEMNNNALSPIDEINLRKKLKSND